MQRRRVKPGDAPGGGKPHPAVTRFRNRWLGNSFCRKPGKSIQSIQALAGNKVAGVAQPPGQLRRRDMGDAGEPVHPKVPSLRFHHAGDSAGQLLIFPAQKVKMAVAKQLDPTGPTQPEAIIPGEHRGFRDPARTVRKGESVVPAAVPFDHVVGKAEPDVSRLVARHGAQDAGLLAQGIVLAAPGALCEMVFSAGRSMDP